MLKASGEVSVEWLTELCNSVIGERKIPEDWQKSVFVPVLKGKVWIIRAMKLLEHGMRVFEQVLEI